jgi:hypothetical protein
VRRDTGGRAGGQAGAASAQGRRPPATSVARATIGHRHGVGAVVLGQIHRSEGRPLRVVFAVVGAMTMGPRRTSGCSSTISS